MLRMRRISRRDAIAGLLAATLVVGVVPSAALGVPMPVPRHAGSDDLVGNAPTASTQDGLTNRKAETAARKAEEARLEKVSRDSSTKDLQAQAIALAAKVQAKELAVSLSEDNIDVLSQRERRIVARLKLGRAQLTDTLAALELLERQKPPALAVKPGDAADAVRSAILLSDIVPRLRGQAETLARQLQDLRTVRTRIEDEHKSLQASAAALKEGQARLDKLLQERTGSETLSPADAQERQRLAALGRRSSSINSLVEGLRAAPRPPSRARKPQESREGVWSSPGSKPKSFVEARGELRMPAVGKIVEKFGVPNESGGSTKGIKINTLPGARVVAPFDGRVKYAGPLKTYGQVLIVEVGNGYLIILAGMAHIDATVGQWLLAGEPVGRMAEADEVGPKELYVEFRRGREPIDPLPWLAGVTKEG